MLVSRSATKSLPIRRPPAGRDWGRSGPSATDLRSRHFDCAILLQNAFEAAAIAWLGRIPVRIGYNRDGRGASAD